MMSTVQNPTDSLELGLGEDHFVLDKPLEMMPFPRKPAQTRPEPKGSEYGENVMPLPIGLSPLH